MLSDMIRAVKDNGAKADADKLPTRDEFRDLATMFTAAALAGGASLTPEQCRMLDTTFATLAVSTITVDD